MDKINKSELTGSAFWMTFFAVPPSLPFLIFGPLLIYLALHKNTAWPLFMMSAAAGLFFWTLCEYILHRFLLHPTLKTQSHQWFCYIFHGIHHEKPKDQYRVAAHPLLSMSLGSMMLLSFHGLLPLSICNGFSFGFILGYLIYDFTHWLLHRNKWRNKVVNTLRRNHSIHHFKDPSTCFGVTSPLWDHIFGTYHKL